MPEISSRGKKVSAAALIATAIAIPAEGLRRVYYLDSASIVTVCYGHTGSDINKNKTYSLEECKSLLTSDMLKAVEQVDKCHPNLPVKVLAAFSDAVYNIGPTIACDAGKSTAARYLYKGDLINACMQLPRWSKSNIGGVMVELPGLVKRRKQEEQLCLEGATNAK